MKFAISRKDNVLIPADASTTAGRYPVLGFKAFRKFATRDAARVYKQGLRNPQNYSIVDTVNQMVVR